MKDFTISCEVRREGLERESKTIARRPSKPQTEENVKNQLQESTSSCERTQKNRPETSSIKSFSGPNKEVTKKNHT
jgi:hypothetical protein